MVMTDENSLVFYRRKRVEEARHRMAALDDMRTNVELQLSDLEAEIMRARWRAAATDAGRQALAPLEKSNHSRQNNLRATLKAIQHERAVMQCDLDIALRVGITCGTEGVDTALSLIKTQIPCGSR